MVDGRAKGNKFEVQIARVISEWFCGKDFSGRKWYQLPFRRRSPGNAMDGFTNGAWDLHHVPEYEGMKIEFPFSVELKNQEKWELDGMFHCDKWKPFEWWDQTLEQAQKTQERLLPMLIFTRNRRATYVLLEERVLKWLRPKAVNAPIVSIKRQDGQSLSLLTMEDMVQVPPSGLVKVYRKQIRAG